MHPTPATPEELDFRHSGWWGRRQKIRRALAAAGMPAARLARFDNCGTDAIVHVHEETGEPCIRATYCHDRWCQPCGRAKALLIADNVRGKIEGEKYLHVVLTKRHKVSPLADQIDELYRQFKRLRDRGLWREAIDGGSAFLQSHVSNRDGLWHVHLHVIASGRWLDKWELSRVWLDVTGDSDNVDVSAISDSEAAAREVSRYAAKPVDGHTVNDPDALAELMRAVQGRHLCFTFGSWRGHRLTRRDPDPEARRYRPVARLSHMLALAAAGDTWAAGIMQVLTRQSHPATGPPHLFYDVDRQQHPPKCTELVTPATLTRSSDRW